MADNTTLSKNVSDIVEKVEKLSLLEVSELVKALEEKFGVSAAAPVMMAAAGGTAAAPVEEKTEFTVMLMGAGANKIASIKAVREIKPELGLAEAKAFVEAAPKAVLENVKKEVAEEAKKKLTDAGATVELK
ncbi:MAG TPA: 50S ribosomal protein L7/L12 [Candidatus Pacebacteria bacterium]|nr:MAG: 50S ribosomal protein L7/L12 [Microgenomates group bacterium GW2011_GWB1_45_17]KKU24265.1 MAG: 50S ribosomal protein L7/L12 [Microgenomates group bacterium GW2011_GWC1_46_15]KKU24981.1 MAG: 50S ribosomal protein L7/L12 [Microgenomates group bacterium GW2011_GWA1_46_15]HAV15622.1 50S ribosomal protein L7/L12 [Candidatus Paceibacterota bacterium]HCR93016.1 50S ribosomal protein L7/L12 [Candidatus Paceibacterota bacterium]